MYKQVVAKNDNSRARNERRAFTLVFKRENKMIKDFDGERSNASLNI